ncbi:uncharacterized protein Dwil_GK20932 [Drosophila willistoni]|uniref:Attacin C-terminal domain-containing protein n=1 Tax=Drosophila willistoni TaxID=7260 RepID=B4MK31_DROWI|nr:diptericin A [Drosophila willistoni]EDW72470.1 uncharacterized protein Dwil_GK20932 [Drosophila willistoni]
MQFTFGLLILGLACALTAAYPQPYPDHEIVVTNPEPFSYSPDFEAPRVRRQLQLQGGGGGSPRQGFDLSLQGRAPVWQSNNGRHQLDATGSYAQHLGGPYGNSRPQWGAGAQYTFRF